MRLMIFVTVVLSFFGCKAGSASAASRGYEKPVKPAKGLTPAPLLSRGKSVVASKRGTNADHLTDGKYKAGVWEGGTPSAEKPSWAAFEIGPGPQRLLLAWTASGSFNHNETTYGGPGSYRVEVSADSTNGEDGAWKPVATVTGNEY